MGTLARSGGSLSFGRVSPLSVAAELALAPIRGSGTSLATCQGLLVSVHFSEPSDTYRKNELTLREESSGKEEETRTQKPFIGTLRVNESRPAKPSQQPEASLAWGKVTSTAKRRQRVPRPCD